MRSAGSTNPATRRRAGNTGCGCRPFRRRLSREPCRRAHPLGDWIFVPLTSAHGPGVRDRGREPNQIELLLEGWGDALLVVEDEIGVLVERAARGELERAARHLRSGAADRLHPLVLEEPGPVPATLRVRAHDENG